MRYNRTESVLSKYEYSDDNDDNDNDGNSDKDDDDNLQPRQHIFLKNYI